MTEAITPATPAGADQIQIRVATFNASLFRNAEGGLVSDLATPGDTQARTAAEIVQRVAPDLLLVNEFDYAAYDAAADLFRLNYLERGQDTLGLGAAAPPIEYPPVFVAPSNTGVASGFDLDNNGAVASEPGDRGYGEDALGFGVFPGQYGMAVFSEYPILRDEVRTFQPFLWKDMPGARLPDDPATPGPGDWYSAEELEVFRLPSKSFWDVPVLVGGEVVHLLAAHPTPPAFDGPEDRNGLRNADENGDSVDDAIRQLLDNPAVDDSLRPAAAGGPEQAALRGGANASHRGDPAFDTADFSDTAPGNLRVDYALPSAEGLAPRGGRVLAAVRRPAFPAGGQLRSGAAGRLPGFRPPAGLDGPRRRLKDEPAGAARQGSRSRDRSE
ncbi:endonuclease/exonuclease/phosphatase family protein [Craurococcus roseus]|uniref:Endonuclease/exonuclease/phosphatase family protein n=1 Tax=Craurococcus roseus TaxID=77585 RepID=A0ABN1EQU9_9PROT